MRGLIFRVDLILRESWDLACYEKKNARETGFIHPVATYKLQTLCRDPCHYAKCWGLRSINIFDKFMMCERDLGKH